MSSPQEDEDNNCINSFGRVNDSSNCLFTVKLTVNFKKKFIAFCVADKLSVLKRSVNSLYVLSL